MSRSQVRTEHCLEYSNVRQDKCSGRIIRNVRKSLTLLGPISNVRNWSPCAIHSLALVTFLFVSILAATDYDNAPTVGPAKGWLVIQGGGNASNETKERFVRFICAKLSHPKNKGRNLAAQPGTARGFTSFGTSWSPVFCSRFSCLNSWSACWRFCIKRRLRRIEQ